MLQNLMYITRPVGRFGLQLLRTQVPAFSCSASRRWFSEKAASEPTAAPEAPKEEIAEPLAHNKFKHVFGLYLSLMDVARSPHV